MVVQRWSLEVTFEEARAHLGMETQRQWSDRAIARTTPVLLGLFSVVTLLAVRWHGEGVAGGGAGGLVRQGGADVLGRPVGGASGLWRARINPGSARGDDPREWPEPLREALLDSLASAA